MADVIGTTWRDLENKIRRILLSQDESSFRTLSVSRPDGSVVNYSSFSDMRALLQEVVQRRREEESASAANDPAKQYGSVQITGGYWW